MEEQKVRIEAHELVAAVLTLAYEIARHAGADQTHIPADIESVFNKFRNLSMTGKLRP